MTEDKSKKEYSKTSERRRKSLSLNEEEFYKKDSSKLNKTKVKKSIEEFTDYDVLDDRGDVWNIINRGGDDGEEESIRINGKSLDKVLKELNNEE